MTEQLTAATPTPDPAPTPAGRKLPRALTPFRHAAYRKLAVALVLSTFASGLWVVGLVWEVIRIGGGPAQLSFVSTAAAVGVLLPALLGGVVADRVPQKSILLVVAAVEALGMGLVATLSLTDSTADLAPGRGLVRDRHGLRVLLPRLLRVAPVAGARVGPDGGQRLRGHGAPDHRPGHRARRGRCRDRCGRLRARRSWWPPASPWRAGSR